MQIETAYRLCFLNQHFEERTTEVVISAKRVMLRQRFEKKWTKTFLVEKYIIGLINARSRQLIQARKCPHWSSDNDSTRNRPKTFWSKNTFFGSKIDIETAYRLYFLRQHFEKWPNEVLFPAKSVHIDVLVKIRQEFDQKLSGSKVHLWAQECKSRQPVDCAFSSNIWKKGQMKHFFLQNGCTMMFW